MLNADSASSERDTRCPVLYACAAIRPARLARLGIGFPDDHTRARADRVGHRISANTLTEGDNGIPLLGAAAPVRLRHLVGAELLLFTLIVFAVALFFIWRLTRSPFGRRCRAHATSRAHAHAGHNVWLIQWLAFVLSAFWAPVAGWLYVYYNLFISPHAISLQHPPKCC